jgi:probable rRNA maturation factor
MDDPLVETVLDDPRWEAVGLETLAERAARAALEGAGVGIEGCEISLLGTDDARMAELNATFRDKAKATNVLSWPSGETEADPDGARFLGDIALAWETCMAEAEAGGIAPADHVTHLVAHGVLHLLGFDHELEGEADAMEALETKILARLGVADPYSR